MLEMVKEENVEFGCSINLKNIDKGKDKVPRQM